MIFMYKNLLIYNLMSYIITFFLFLIHVKISVFDCRMVLQAKISIYGIKLKYPF